MIGSLAPLVMASMSLLADTSESRFLAALRERDLFRLLDRQGTRLLRQGDLDGAADADLVAALAGYWSDEGATNLDPQRRRESWAKADRLIADYLARRAGDDRAQEVRYSWGESLLRRARVLGRLAEVFPKVDSLRRDAIAAAHQSVDVLSDNAESLEKTRSRKLSPRTGSQLTAAQINDLLAAGEIRQGLAYLVIARWAADDKSRADALAQCRRRLERLTPGEKAPPLAIEGLLALAEADTLAGQPDEARRRIDELAGLALSPESRGRVQLAQARARLDGGDVAATLSILEASAESAEVSPEWSLLLAEAWLARTESSPRLSQAEAVAFERKAIDAIDRLEERFGGYWARRGERLLAKKLAANPATVDVALLHRLARAQAAEGNKAEARKLFERARDLAERAGDAARAAETEYQAALLLADENPVDASKRLLALAEKHGNSQVADQSLLRAATLTAPAYRKDPVAKEQYRRALDSLVARKGLDPSVMSEVRYRLGSLAEGDGRAADAIAHYREVSPSSAFGQKAVEAQAGLWHDRFFLSKSKASPDERDRAIAELARLLDAGADLPVATKSTLRFVAARLRLAREASDREALAWLDDIAKSPEAAPDLRARAGRVRLDLALAAGDAPTAAGLAKTAFSGREKDLVSLLKRLRPAQPGLSPTVRDAQIAAIDAAAETLLAESAKLSPRDSYEIRLLVGQAMAARSDHGAACRVFKRLLAENSKDARVKASLADSLLRSGEFRESRQYWREMLRGLPRGSGAWFDAVRSAAECELRIGQVEAARGLIDPVVALYPELGGPERKKAFEALQREIAAAKGKEAGLKP